MPNTVTKRWQNWGQLALGVWMFVSPWVLAYQTEPTPAWNAYVLGAAIAIIAAIALLAHQPWQEWGTLALGVWLGLSPWVLAFSSQREVTANAVIVAIVVVGLAIWAMLHDKGGAGWSQKQKTT